MDIKKIRWMAKARMIQIWDRLRFLYYDVRVKWGRRHAFDTTYYSNRRELMRSFLKMDLEEEYLKEMGLWVEPEIESEQKAEPDLIRELFLVDLITRAVGQGETTYVPVSVKEYTNRFCITINKVGPSQEMEEASFELPPCAPGERYIRFTMDGGSWAWDTEEMALRFLSNEPYC